MELPELVVLSKVFTFTMDLPELVEGQQSFDGVHGLPEMGGLPSCERFEIPHYASAVA